MYINYIMAVLVFFVLLKELCLCISTFKSIQNDLFFGFGGVDRSRLI